MPCLGLAGAVVVVGWRREALWARRLACARQATPSRNAIVCGVHIPEKVGHREEWIDGAEPCGFDVVRRHQ